MCVDGCGERVNLARVCVCVFRTSHQVLGQDARPDFGLRVEFAAKSRRKRERERGGVERKRNVWGFCGSAELSSRSTGGLTFLSERALSLRFHLFWEWEWGVRCCWVGSGDLLLPELLAETAGSFCCFFVVLLPRSCERDFREESPLEGAVR